MKGHHAEKQAHDKRSECFLQKHCHHHALSSVDHQKDGLGSIFLLNNFFL